MMRRPTALGGGIVASLTAAAWWPAPRAARNATFSVVLTGAQWRAKLNPTPYQILRQQGTEVPGSFGVQRTEVHCSRCCGHLGRVFSDGPRPTGLRCCMKGGARTFTVTA
jgi:peptide methionine sulfoxide reductase MsrB